MYNIHKPEDHQAMLNKVMALIEKNLTPIEIDMFHLEMDGGASELYEMTSSLNQRINPHLYKFDDGGPYFGPDETEF